MADILGERDWWKDKFLFADRNLKKECEKVDALQKSLTEAQEENKRLRDALKEINKFTASGYITGIIQSALNGGK